MPDYCNSAAGDEAKTTRTNSSTHKKRKLNNIKCDRCRQDKQRCDPVDRVWPEKCDRCASKDLPCSEGKKAGHAGKQDLEFEQGSDASESGDTDGEFQKLVSRWMVLSRYRENLYSLRGQVRKVRRESDRSFPSYGSNYAEGFIDSETSIVTTTDTVTSELMEVTAALMKWTRPRSIPETLFPMLLQAERTQPDSVTTDCICDMRFRDLFLGTFASNGDVFGEFLALQRIILIFMNTMDGSSCCQGTSKCIQEAMSQYCKMARSSLCSVVEVLEDLGQHTAAEMARRVGLHQPEPLGYYLYELLDNVADIPVMLEQNALQQWLAFAGPLRKLPHRPSWMEINKQDILGRSSLHIACLGNKSNVLDALLSLGANTNARTMCGRTALHFAAANDNKLVCEKLLEYCGRSQVEVQDVKGCMARNYTNRADIVELLDSHAGRGDRAGRPTDKVVGPGIDLPGLSHARSSATGVNSYVSQLDALISTVHGSQGSEGGWDQTSWPSTSRSSELFQERGHDGSETATGGGEGRNDASNQRSMTERMEASLDIEGSIPPYDYHLRPV